MSLIQNLQDNVKEAMKSGDSFKLGTMRMLLAAIQNEHIAKGKDKEFTDEEALGVLRRELKKRREAATLYVQGGRQDLADKENSEAEFIKTYLPAELTDSELEKIVKEVMAGGETNLGKLMGQIVPKVSGRAEPRRISEVVKKFLG